MTPSDLNPSKRTLCVIDEDSGEISFTPLTAWLADNDWQDDLIDLALALGVGESRRCGMGFSVTRVDDVAEARAACERHATACQAEADEREAAHREECAAEAAAEHRYESKKNGD
jgi:hypothetical protein